MVKNNSYGLGGAKDIEFTVAFWHMQCFIVSIADATDTFGFNFAGNVTVQNWNVQMDLVSITFNLLCRRTDFL
jgi:hypothetical protein